jgi:hypothetical protein
VVFGGWLNANNLARTRSFQILPSEGFKPQGSVSDLS